MAQGQWSVPSPTEDDGHRFGDWRSGGTQMVRTINCTACQRRIKIEGSTDGSREIFQPVICPFCETPNEVRWPIGSGRTVGLYDPDERP